MKKMTTGFALLFALCLSTFALADTRSIILRCRTKSFPAMSSVSIDIWANGISGGAQAELREYQGGHRIETNYLIQSILGDGDKNPVVYEGTDSAGHPFRLEVLSENAPGFHRGRRGVVNAVNAEGGAVTQEQLVCR